MSRELLVNIPSSSSPTNTQSVGSNRACPLLEGSADEWVACCTARLHCVAKRIAGDDVLALDILQESWIKVIQSVTEYRGGPPACAWVAAIVRNTAKNSVRTRHLRGESPLRAADNQSEPGCDPEGMFQRQEMLLLLGRIIRTLPETHRQVLELRYKQDLSTGRVACILGISPSNVSSRLNRALALLRRRFHAQLRKKRRQERVCRTCSAGDSTPGCGLCR